jgi:DNA-binding HxlR family transcriptional regulator
MEMAQSKNRKEKILMILVEHLGGLRYEELMDIASKKNIGSKATLNKLVKELCEDGLVVRNELGRYVINVAEEMLKPVRKCFLEIPKQVEDFINNLFVAYASNKGEGAADVFLKVGARYVIYKTRLIMLNVNILFPYLFDERFSELYHIGLKCALDSLIGSLDKLAQKFKGISLKELLLDKEVREKYLLPHFEEQMRRLTIEMRLDMEEIEKMINQLDISESLKINLKRYV